MFYWDQLSRGVPPRAIASFFSRRYGGADTIGIDLQDFFEKLDAEQLIRPSTTRSEMGEPDAAKLPAEFARPVLSQYDDVAEMLLLDPVHDVGEAGWPQPAPAKTK
jgi:hypothetical protein